MTTIHYWCPLRLVLRLTLQLSRAVRRRLELRVGRLVNEAKDKR